MTESEDHWLTVAMADTAVVAEILLKLRVATLPPPSKRRRPPPPPLPLPSWTIHQRRSRTQPASNKSETPTASPTTPLSWSGATSVSGGGAPIADVVDSSTQPNHNRSDISRSKVTAPRETITKRPRKKKTLAALKMEEVVLMEEQDHLKMKLAALQANYEKQVKENVRLRKIKLDIQVEPQRERPKTIDDTHFETVARIVLPDLNVPFGEDVIVSY